MTRRRWIADQFSSTQAVLVGAHAEHLSRVLRARIGQEFDITTGNQVRRGRITAVRDDQVVFELSEEVPASSPLHVTLALSIFKFDRMEWAIEKCTELGVARIIPVIAHRTESHLATAATKRVERWRRVVLQAAEQSRRLSPPEMSQPLKLKDATALPGNQRIFLSENEPEIMLKDIFQAHNPQDDVLLAVGPEGGWTDEESKLFTSAGWRPASLGRTILRAETAAISAIAIVSSELQ